MTKSYFRQVLFMAFFVLSVLSEAKTTSPLACSVQVLTKPVTCNGLCDGKAWAVPAGGTAPYTYSWSNAGITDTITGLCPGSYTVQVTDAVGCTISNSVMVTSPSVLTLKTTSIKNVTCFGVCNGRATINAAGGNNRYTYSWNTGFMGTNDTVLCSGTFTAMVTDSLGCSAKDTIVITAPATGLSGSISGIMPVKCGGQCNGRATLTMAGGTAPYSYMWTGGKTAATDSNLCAGFNLVNVTDQNGCQFLDSVNISAPSPLTASTSQMNERCNGGSTGVANVTPAGGTAPYTYSWTPNPVPTGLKAGPEICFVTDSNGCKLTKFFFITQPTPIRPTLFSKPASCGTCANGSDSVHVVGGVGNLSYLWTPGGCTTPVCSGLAAGTYTCCVTDSMGCSACKTISIAVTGITEQTMPEMTIFPNPAGESIQIQLPVQFEIRALHVFNEIGQEVIQIANFKPGLLDIAALAKGTYIIQLDSDAGSIHKLFIKN